MMIGTKAAGEIKKNVIIVIDKSRMVVRGKEGIHQDRVNSSVFTYHSNRPHSEASIFCCEVSSYSQVDPQQTLVRSRFLEGRGRESD